MPGVRRESCDVNALLVTASVAPLLAAPSLRAEMVSQLVLGEGAEVDDTQGDMLHVRSLLDGYSGWIAAGYGVRLSRGEADGWLAGAAWSEGAVLTTRGGTALRAPHRARLRLVNDGVAQLPTGEHAAIYAGSVRSHEAMVADARRERAPAWAWRQFAGTPYLWGGITGAGIDCSGLVQTTYLARGVTLPRDAAQQAGYGDVIEPGHQAAGDLLFFRARDSNHVAHVAWLDADDMLVHSTVDTGGVTRESLIDGGRAQALLARLVAVRRLS